MPPNIALDLWFVLLLLLLLFDPAKERKTSAALWVPLTWLFITASRLPSQWLGGSMDAGAEAMEEGNPTDRLLLSVLILLAAFILASRKFNLATFIRQNKAFALVLGFAFISVVWSDFPLIAAKRWFRDLGNYLVIFVVLTDPDPLGAVRQLIRRLAYILVPLSIVLVKYFTYMGIHYSAWTGAPEFVGVTTSKNMLGVMCLISSIFFVWDTVTRWSDKEGKHRKKIILLNLTFIGMTLWLLHISSSATSQVCLVVASLIIFIANTKHFKRKPALLLVSIPVAVCLYLILAFGFDVDINAVLATFVGRDPTLTGRTVIWDAVMSTHTNPVLGTGYESFWLGQRLRQVWTLTGPGINEAHNGYLEVYLNQGIVGVVLLIGFLGAAYATVCNRVKTISPMGTLNLALWTIVPFYNVTESAFKGQLMWIVFLLGVMVVPRRGESRGDALANPAQTLEPSNASPELVVA